MWRSPELPRVGIKLLAICRVFAGPEQRARTPGRVLTQRGELAALQPFLQKLTMLRLALQAVDPAE